MNHNAERFGLGTAKTDEWMAPFVPRMPGGNATLRTHVPDANWSFDLSKVPPRYAVEVGGHTFERVVPSADATTPDNDPYWRHHIGPEQSERINFIYFEQDKRGNPTFARWGRVVLREGDVLGYADEKHVVHNLGQTATVSLIDPEGQVYTPMDAAIYLNFSEQLQQAEAEGGDMSPQAPLAYNGMHRIG